MFKTFVLMLGSAFFAQDVPKPTADDSPFQVDDPEAAQQAIPRFLTCLRYKANTQSKLSATYRDFKGMPEKGCPRWRVYEKFKFTIGNIVLGTAAYSARARKIDAVIDARIAAEGLTFTQAWYEQERAKLRYPRFQPADAPACAKRAFGAGPGNYAAVETALTTKAPARSQFDTSAVAAGKQRLWLDRALSAADKEGDTAYVYRRLPVRFSYSGGSVPAQYDADASRLSVQIEDWSGPGYAGRDYPTKGTLDMGITTIRNGSWAAQNDFGATARVTDYTSILHVWRFGWGSDDGVAYRVSIDVEMSAAEIKRRAPNLRVLLLGALEPPYAVRENVRYRLPTVSNPSNEAIDVLTVYARPMCAALYDGATKTILSVGAFIYK